jgi:hypothetical protein
MRTARSRSPGTAARSASTRLRSLCWSELEEETNGGVFLGIVGAAVSKTGLRRSSCRELKEETNGGVFVEIVDRDATGTRLRTFD